VPSSVSTGEVTVVFRTPNDTLALVLMLLLSRSEEGASLLNNGIAVFGNSDCFLEPLPTLFAVRAVREGSTLRDDVVCLRVRGPAEGPVERVARASEDSFMARTDFTEAAAAVSTVLVFSSFFRSEGRGAE
jgi:hypothetical protein